MIPIPKKIEEIVKAKVQNMTLDELIPQDAKIKYPKEEIVILDLINRPGELHATYVGDLVRCKNCIHFADGRNGMCKRTHSRMNADDYCSRGRAK